MSPPKRRRNTTPLPREAYGLSRKMVLFAQLVAANPTVSRAELATRAGYSEHSAVTSAARLYRDPRIRALVRALLLEMHDLMPVQATGLIEAVTRGDFDDPKRAAVQLQAAKLGLGLGKMAPIQQISVEQRTTVVHEMSVEAALAEIQKLGFGLRDDPPTIEHEPMQIEHKPGNTNE